MSFVEVHTFSLIGRALDWAVAKCEGRKIEFNYQYTEETRFDGWWQLGPNHWQPLNSYSTNWAQGGPIIERERIGVKYTGNALEFVAWRNGLRSIKYDKYGPTPLIAAMRCYVASKLGDAIQIPKELAP